jgi:hypothetical protein
VVDLLAYLLGYSWRGVLRACCGKIRDGERDRDGIGSLGCLGGLRRLLGVLMGAGGGMEGLMCDDGVAVSP